MIDGFGNHNPGNGQFSGMISRWDVLHPGRPWAPKFAKRPEDAAQLAKAVEAHLVVAPEDLRDAPTVEK